MKIFPVILLQCLTIATSASTQEAYIYTHDIRPRSYPHTDPVAPDTAYSIWSRRLELLERRRLSSVQDSVLEQIDTFGGYQPLLFQSALEQTKPLRLSIVIEGFDDDKAQLELDPHITVTQPSQELSSRLKTKTINAGASADRVFNWTFATKDKLGVFLELRYQEPNDGAREEQLKSLLGQRNSEQQHLPHLLQLLQLDQFSIGGNRLEIAFLQLDYTKMTGITAHERSAMIRDLLSYLNPRLASFASSGFQESTIVLLPSTATSPRSLPKNVHLARQLSEDEEETLTTASFPQLSTTQSNSSNSSQPPKLAPGTFLPTCFSSLSSCTNATNNCSGRGSCSKKHVGCYACRCSRTIVRYNDDGTTKSVQWGGTACEKKDISVEFWLFAGFGVAMMALVAGGIGLLYSMGAEELPSVIGAGVAGPRATK